MAELIEYPDGITVQELRDLLDGLEDTYLFSTRHHRGIWVSLGENEAAQVTSITLMNIDADTHGNRSADLMLGFDKESH